MNNLFTFSIFFLIKILLIIIILFTQNAATEDVHDLTVAYTGDEPVPEAIPDTDQDPDDFIAPSNIPRYDKVVALAVLLITLKDSSGALTHNQASTIVKLWNDLSEYDKSPSHLLPVTNPEYLIVDLKPA